MSGNPFHIEGPAVISFSGGRTSAYMLYRILEEGLQENVHILFANTGRERPETLDFVRDVSSQWRCQIHWLERVVYSDRTTPYDKRFQEVDYHSASRDATPFENLLHQRGYLPNPLMRICTQELKIRVMKHWMLSRGYQHWDMIIGLRYDEPRRVMKQRQQNENNKERWIREMPLYDAEIRLSDIMMFWLNQPFDLQLKPYEGNCDCCFLKSLRKKQLINHEHPELIEWWVRQEEIYKQPFRIDQPSYVKLREIPFTSTQLGDDDDDQIDCSCTD